MTDAAAELQFTCPRCHESVAEIFYGPCTPCRDQLRADLSGEAKEVEVERFEPALHVTPNAVALKE